MQTAASLLVGLGKYREVDLIPRVAAAGFEALDLHHFAFPDRPEWKDTASAAAELDTFAPAAADAGRDWVQGHGPVVVGPEVRRVRISREELAAPSPAAPAGCKPQIDLRRQDADGRPRPAPLVHHHPLGGLLE